jgi:hypothetical protein
MMAISASNDTGDLYPREELSVVRTFGSDWGLD